MSNDDYSDDATELRQPFAAPDPDATIDRKALRRPVDPDATHEAPALDRRAATSRPAPRPQHRVSAPAPPQAPMLQPRPADAAEQLRRLGLSRRKKANANNVRPNSGFYSLPDANATMGVDATVVGPVNFSDDNRDAIGLLVGLCLGLVCGLGLMTYAIARWSAPGELLGVGMLLMIVCGIITGGLVLPRENLHKEDIKRAIIPMGISLALVLISALCWQIGTVRNTMRPFASEAATMSERVLDDRSVEVAVAECKRLADKLDSRAYRETIARSLAGKRAIATRCLAELDDDRAEALSAYLASTWYTELTGPDIDGEQACDLADSMAALDRPTGDIETRLLACVLSVPTDAVQSCCGVSLVKHVTNSKDNWVAAVASSDQLGSEESTAAGLMTLAFHQQGVTGSQQEFVKAAKFNGAAGRRLALSFACNALQEGAERLSKHFAASLGECAIDEARVPRSREVWVDVCEDAQRRVANAEEPAKALCAATRVALVGHAVTDASRIVAQASKDRTKSRDLAVAIDVEANTTRGSLDEGFEKLNAWGKERARRNRAPNNPTFKPDW